MAFPTCRWYSFSQPLLWLSFEPLHKAPASIFIEWKDISLSNYAFRGVSNGRKKKKRKRFEGVQPYRFGSSSKNDRSIGVNRKFAAPRMVSIERECLFPAAFEPGINAFHGDDGKRGLPPIAFHVG